MKLGIHTILGLNAPEEAMKRLQEERHVLTSHENIALWTRGLKQKVLDCAQLQWLFYLEQLSYAIVSLQVYSENSKEREGDGYSDLKAQIERTYQSVVDIFETLVRLRTKPYTNPKLLAIHNERMVRTLSNAERQLKEFDKHSRKHHDEYTRNQESVASRLIIIQDYARYNFFQRLSEIYYWDKIAYQKANLMHIRAIQNAIMNGDLKVAKAELDNIHGLDSYEPSSVDEFLREFEKDINEKKLAKG